MAAGATASPWLQGPLEWMKVALIVWMPLYVLLMQKRVYGQGWTMTLFKYGVLGFSYTVLLSIGAVLTIIASLVSA